MIAIAAALCLVTWLDTGRAWWAVLTVVLSASLPYLHPLATPVLGAFAIYGIARVREGTSAVRARGLLVAGAIIAIALVPVVRELQQLAGRSSDWVVPLPLSITSVFPMIVPPSLLVVAVVLYLVWPRIIAIRTLRAVRRSSHILLISWFVLPTLVLIALALLSPVKLLWARYFIFVAPAGAILAGMALRSIGPARARRLAVLGLLALSVVQLASPVKLGDFRATAALERAHATDQTVVLYPASYTESLQPDWYEDPVKASFLASPLDYYPLTGDVVVLPQQLTPQDEAFVRARVDQAVATSDDVIAITVLGTSYDAWLDAYMTDRGYEREDLGTETFFVVTKYSKP